MGQTARATAPASNQDPMVPSGPPARAGSDSMLVWLQGVNDDHIQGKAGRQNATKSVVCRMEMPQIMRFRDVDDQGAHAGAMSRDFFSLDRSFIL